MASTFLPVLLLLVFIVLSSCSKRVVKYKRSQLHNYPIINAHECPVDFENYDEEYVAKQAKLLGMRPVDYLHMHSKLKYEQRNTNNNNAGRLGRLLQRKP